MPVYNAASCVENALHSILGQTFSRYELLIMDACSSDNTLKIIEQHLLNNPQIRVLSQKDKGIYDAMNQGIALARGEWIYFMGSDDELYGPLVLENVTQSLTYDYDIVYGDIIWVPNGIEEKGEWSHRKLLQQNINHQRIFYRRRLFEKHHHYNLEYSVAADHELNVRLFCDPSVRKRHMSLLITRYHAGGFSSNKIDEVFWSNWDNIILKNFRPWIARREIYQSLNWYCWYHIRIRRFRKAAYLFLKIYTRTYSFGFLKNTFSQLLKVLSLHRYNSSPT